MVCTGYEKFQFNFCILVTRPRSRGKHEEIPLSCPALMGIVVPPKYLVTFGTLPAHTRVLLFQMVEASSSSLECQILAYATSVVKYLKDKRASLSIFQGHSTCHFFSRINQFSDKNIYIYILSSLLILYGSIQYSGLRKPSWQISS